MRFNKGDITQGEMIRFWPGREKYEGASYWTIKSGGYEPMLSSERLGLVLAVTTYRKHESDRTLVLRVLTSEGIISQICSPAYYIRKCCEDL